MYCTYLCMYSVSSAVISAQTSLQKPKTLAFGVLLVVGTHGWIHTGVFSGILRRSSLILQPVYARSFSRTVISQDIAWRLVCSKDVLTGHLSERLRLVPQHQHVETTSAIERWKFGHAWPFHFDTKHSLPLYFVSLRNLILEAL